MIQFELARAWETIECSGKRWLWYLPWNDSSQHALSSWSTPRSLHSLVSEEESWRDWAYCPGLPCPADPCTCSSPVTVLALPVALAEASQSLLLYNSFLAEKRRHLSPLWISYPSHDSWAWGKWTFQNQPQSLFLQKRCWNPTFTFRVYTFTVNTYSSWHLGGEV